MLDGMPLIDVHLHAARLPTLKLPRETWLQGFAGSAAMDRLYDADGTVVPVGVRRLPGGRGRRHRAAHVRVLTRR